jgi:alpha-tubulin suppressor-like RCC1 family protein
MGENTYGALGIGSEDYDHVEDFPTRVPLKTRCVQIASNSTFHVLALLSNGKLFGWGVNDGQLGNIDEETPTNLPVEIELPFGERIRSIYAGGNGHKGVSYLITEMGRIFAMGNNEFGQLGLGDKETRYQPTMLKRWATITSFSIGGHHVLALSDEERVYACGHNLYKQLGTQANMDNFYFGEVKDLRDEGIIQVCAGGFFSAALSRNGSVFLWGRSQECQCALSDNIIETPYRLKSLTRVVDIAVGWCHVIAHTDEGKTYEWGALKDGDQFTYQMVTQVPNAPKNIVKLYCGLYSSFALYN